MKKTIQPKPRCPRCSGTRLLIVETPQRSLVVVCETPGCFAYPVNTALAKPNKMSDALHKLQGELSMMDVWELRQIRLDKNAIAAIKRLREITGCSLKDAHAYVKYHLLEDSL